MNIVPYTIPLFEDLDTGPLKYFDDFLNQIPYAPLISVLNKERDKGRNDYPNDTMFRCKIAGMHFKHTGPTELISELERNPSLRHACRLTTKVNKNGKSQLAPSSSAFSRFEKRLMTHQALLDDILQSMTETLGDVLPDFGECVALDGKIIPAYAQSPSKKTKADDRSEQDATYTKKTYTHTTDAGEKISKTTTYFGFRVHLMVDSKYELPVSYEVTPANEGEPTVAKRLIKGLPEWLSTRCQYLLADRGYDGLPLQALIETKGITPIIDIKNQWQGDDTRQYEDTDFVYKYNGEVYYVTDRCDLVRAYYKGYHKASDSLRYETHAKDGHGGHKISIKRSTDPRIFNLVGRDSKKFKRLYKARTSVERVNGRIDRDYLFENHRLRGLRKVNLQVSLTFIMMQAKALLKLAQAADTKQAA